MFPHEVRLPPTEPLWVVPMEMLKSPKPPQIGGAFTKHQLFSLLATRGEADLLLPDKKVRILQSIEREDGSGSSFNLKVWNSTDQKYETIYVRTID